jgi:hypothetical protein
MRQPAPRSMPTPQTLRNPFLAFRLACLAALLLLLPSTPALAQKSADQAGVGRDITIPEGETAGDIACAFCSVHIHGDVRGDVAVLFGSVILDSDHNISGDIAILGGDLTLRNDSHVGGDVAIAAGDLSQSPGATIRGSQTVFPGRFWLVVPLVPFFILIGIILLIVYLIRRNRYRVPVYPPTGRRI